MDSSTGDHVYAVSTVQDASSILLPRPPEKYGWPGGPPARLDAS